jgi:predicted Zn finger-like uncharacterized protein
MILTCPQCDTRYSVDGSKFPATGRTVRCAKCGHSWHQAAEAPEPAIPNVPEIAPEPVPEPEAGAVAAAGDAPLSSSPTRAFAPASHTAAERKPLGDTLKVIGGWVLLIGGVLALVAAAISYRQTVAVIWPQSAGVYSSLGLHVNTTGIDFRQVDYRRESEDGQVVLEVTGQIFNGGTRELAVPQTVRVTLSDASNHELYHWTFKPSVTTLKAGASIAFTTRLSSPPDAARHLEVRFAKDAS